MACAGVHACAGVMVECHACNPDLAAHGSAPPMNALTALEGGAKGGRQGCISGTLRHPPMPAGDYLRHRLQAAPGFNPGSGASASGCMGEICWQMMVHEPINHLRACIGEKVAWRSSAAEVSLIF